MTSVLLPYQQRWVADPSPFKVGEKGRRTGLTWAEASDDALIAASDRLAGGQHVYYVGQDKDMTEEYIEACAMWSKEYNYAAGQIESGIWEESDDDKNRNILTYSIRYPSSGHRITALASRPRKLRGRQGVLVGDEAAFQDDLDALLKAAMAFLIWGGKVRLISTHFGVDNDFNTLCSDIRAGRQPGSLHRITFAQAVEEGLYKRVCLRTGKVWTAEGEREWVNGIYEFYRANAAEELDCIPSNSTGAYLSRALIEQRMSEKTPVLRYECKDGFDQLPDATREAEVQGWIESVLAPVVQALPKTARSSLGMDFGRSGDLSVIVPLLESQGLQRTCPFTIELRNVPFRQQEQILFWLADHLPRFCFGALDARGNGQYLAEVAMQRYGSSSIAQVMLSNPWYLENFPKLKAALEDGTLDELPRDRDVLDDLRTVVVEKGIPKIPDKHGKGSDGGQRHGDAAVAFCLAWFASNQGGGPMEYIEVPLRQRARRAITDDAPAFESRRDW